MTDAEMNSYRFNSGKEPTDEMLSQVMKEAAEDATKRHEVALRNYFDELHRDADKLQSKWADRINQVKNG